MIYDGSNSPMDPENYESAYEKYVLGRENQQGKDLNRDFPKITAEYWKQHNPTRKRYVNVAFSQRLTENLTYDGIGKETEIMVKHFAENHYDYAINYHDGAKLVNYGLDLCSNHERLDGYNCESLKSRAPDHLLFSQVSKKFADAHSDMTGIDQDDYSCTRTTDGTISGGHWYSVGGSMADYHYLTACWLVKFVNEIIKIKSY